MTLWLVHKISNWELSPTSFMRHEVKQVSLASNVTSWNVIEHKENDHWKSSQGMSSSITTYMTTLQNGFACRFII